MTPSELQARAIEAAKMAMTAKIKSLGLDGQSLLCALGAVENLETGIAEYEAALWCSDMDVAPRGGTPVLTLKNGRFGSVELVEFDEYGWRRVGDTMWTMVSCHTAWRYPPAAPGEG